MRSILPALCLALLLPTALGANPVVVPNECESPLKLAAFPTKTCECQHDNSIRADNGVGCAASAPLNSDVLFRMQTRIYQGRRSVNFGMSVAAACPAPFVVSYASASGPSHLNFLQKRRPDAVQCRMSLVQILILRLKKKPQRRRAPTVRSAAATSAQDPDCDAGYKPSPDETQCVPARANVTVSELDCGADAGSVGFLTADPVEGCVCKPTMTENFCGVAVGDPDAEMKCTDTTSSSGVREIKCAVQCTAPAFVANAQNKCEEAESETSTLAGTNTPRDSFETPCTEKVYKLPGKAGCKCAASPPTGGQECRGAGENEYVICRYRKGSNRAAACSKNCVQGTYPDETAGLRIPTAREKKGSLHFSELNQVIGGFPRFNFVDGNTRQLPPPENGIERAGLRGLPGELGDIKKRASRVDTLERNAKYITHFIADTDHFGTRLHVRELNRLTLLKRFFPTKTAVYILGCREPAPIYSGCLQVT
ncbi:hypothetical protein B0H16DRAFT_1477118 [Mycena metata]|uniref:Uncharacterized protein n=1 Tax=Mycena metata TaxID=1033252 RepID=A0AAD7H9Q8_9AGAR|nr:hypothetical protein B0H16DRAFT_1477118 [Mycena metata]